MQAVLEEIAAIGGISVGVMEGGRLQKYSAVRIFGRSVGGKPNFLIKKVQEYILATSVNSKSLLLKIYIKPVNITVFILFNLIN